MGYESCITARDIRTWHDEGYRTSEGKNIIAWPPSSCFDNIYKDHSKTEDPLYSLYAARERDIVSFLNSLKNYGISKLYIGADVRIFYEIANSEWSSKDVIIHFQGGLLENFSATIQVIDENGNHENITGRISDLIANGYISRTEGIILCMDACLHLMKDVFETVGKQPFIPIYGFWHDEPQGSKSGAFTEAELEAIYEYINVQRASYNPIYTNRGMRDVGVYETQFFISTYGQVDYALYYKRFADKIFYSGYEHTLEVFGWNMPMGDVFSIRTTSMNNARIALELLYGIDSILPWADEIHWWDQRRKWSDLKQNNVNAGALIHFEHDVSAWFKPQEFNDLLAHATRLRWTELGVIGGEKQSCEDFLAILKQFCEAAVRSGWMQRKGYYTYVKKWYYCWKDNCNCDQTDLTDGWYEYPPPWNSPGNEIIMNG